MTKNLKLLVGASGVALLLISTIPAFSQKSPLRFSRYTINNGLSENLVYAITQDRQGFMWFGTQDGLDRFDGYDFTVFRHDPFDTTSISDNTIIALYTDSKGRLWIGTAHGGLNLYDRAKNRFLHFLTYHTDTSKVSGDYIESITEDKKGNLWIGTFGNGLFEFIFPENDQSDYPKIIVHYIHQPGDSTSLSGNYIFCVFADAKGRLWLSYMSHPMQMAPLNQKKIQFITPKFTVVNANQIILNHEMQYDVKHPQWVKDNMTIGGAQISFLEKQHQLWVGMGDGLYLLKAKSDTVIRFDFSQPWAKQGAVLSVCEAPGSRDTSHFLWLGTYYGLQIFNTQHYTLRLVKNDPLNKESLVGGRILKIYKDKSGCIWLGSNGNGMSKYDFRSGLFSVHPYYSADSQENTGALSILSFFETKKYLLIGTFTDFWKINKKTGLLSQPKENASKDIANEGNKGAWPELVFDAIPADSGKLWLGGGDGLIYYDPENDQSVLYSTNIVVGGRHNDAIVKIYSDHHGHLWALTQHTFSKFNIATKTFKNYYYNYKVSNQVDELPHGNIYCDREGNFWLGGNQGLLYFNTTNKTFRHFTNNPKDTSSLSFNTVECIVPDPRDPNKYLWIGTAGGGLNRFDLQTKKFIHLTMKNGLPDNNIHGIVTDKQGNLWLSTNKGITKFNPVTGTFQNYTVRQGLPSDEFNPGSYYKNNQGKIYFGSINGFVAFDPDKIKPDQYAPPVVFTDFRLFNKSIFVQTKNSPLKQSITETKEITLPFKDNIISFQTSALNYSNTDQTQYAYRLKNFNKSWISNGTNRLITFSNLSPGRYTLQVKAANSDGVWSKQITSMDLVILPPWWRTWWAYLIYFVLILTVIMLARYEELRRLRLKNSLQIEHLGAEKLKEIDHLKSRFFANISHEFRTPLTLIIGPMEDFLKDGDIDKLTGIFPEMHRSSKRLLQLINQLLDLSRLDAHRYEINTNREDIIPFVEQIVHTFSSLAERNHITLKTKIDPYLKEFMEEENLHVYFDDDIIEKILNNLLSNAFKFTPEGGSITVSVNMSLTRNGFLELKVEDTGTGIPQEKLPYIFDRFYQVNESGNSGTEGSGIGLALLKELVELHQGTISVKSEVNKGAVFYCYLPMNKKIITHPKPAPVKEEDITEIFPDETAVTSEEENINNNKDLPVILVVEDHPDVRKYIRQKLQDNYEVMEAVDGKDGLEKALEQIPDLVLSDVMMSGIDGFELCKSLKTDSRTSHIPVILLTARAAESDKLTGLETGADAYLIKPFNAEELRIRVKNLIDIRNKLRAKFSDRLIVKPSEVAVTSLDKTFINDLLSIVEKNIPDCDFTVVELSKEMHISVSQLNRKMKAVINQTAVQFILSVRMHRALELLKSNAGNIGEISGRVGFENPGYFTQVFKKHFGFLPSEKEKFPEG